MLQHAVRGKIRGIKNYALKQGKRERSLTTLHARL